jgi:hypothetical protein
MGRTAAAGVGAAASLEVSFHLQLKSIRPARPVKPVARAAGMICGVPRPKSEREAWTEELNALPAQIAEHQRQLATPVGDKERRENLAWRIRRDEKRMVELRSRLGSME